MSNHQNAGRNSSDTTWRTLPLIFQPAEGMEVHGLRLVRPLGAGAMGEVWLATDPTRAGDDQTGYVAAKFLPPELQRVKREWRRVERVFRDVQGLQHPGICPLYQLHTSVRHGPCLVMKYIEAQTLMDWRDTYFDQHGDFPLSAAIPVLRKIAEALDYAHDPETTAGHIVPKVIHRDIKPENILVTADGKGVQLVDFGIASRLRQTMVSISNRPLDSSGTRPYMAPEQWRCEETDARTDQYALGVVAYELLADRLPFEAHDQFALERAVLERPVPPIRDFPGHVHEAIAQAMAKQPDDRFSTCVAFIAALAGPPATKADNPETIEVDSHAAPVSDSAVSVAEKTDVSKASSDSVVNSSTGGNSDTSPTVQVSVTDDVAHHENGDDLIACNADWQAAADTVIEASCEFGDIEAELLNEQQARIELLKTFVPSSQTVSEKDQKIAEVTERLEQQQRVVVDRLADRDRADAMVCEAIDSQIAALEAEVSRLTDLDGLGYRTEAAPVQQVQTQIDQLRKQKTSYLPGLQRHRGETEPIRIREFLEEPANLIRERTTELGIEIRKLPAGTFQMSSDAGDDEKPVHAVRISRPFWLAKYPVTVGQTLHWLNKQKSSSSWIDWNHENCPVKRGGWGVVLNTASPYGKSEDQPMVMISWQGAMAFCEWATKQDSEFRYSLPTEAQWEYACRAGTTTSWFCGDEESAIGDVAWLNENAHGVTHPVGEKQPNPWGLHDMAGNVWEWCADWYEKGWYGQSPAEDPAGPDSGSSRVLRGGSWGSNASGCRSACRGNRDPADRDSYIGFRVLCEF